MRSSKKQITFRREKIKKMLQNSKENVIKGVDFAKLFGVCAATIHKDIAFLNSNECPIQHVQTKGRRCGYILSKFATREDDIAVLRKEFGIRVGQENRVVPLSVSMFDRFKNTKEFPIVSSVFQHLCPISSRSALTNVIKLRQKFLG
jgi:hypothetical protein